MASVDASAGNTAANATTETEKIFNFFGLARELRDKIYDNLFTATRFAVDRNGGIIEVDVCNAPRFRHLLVNRQFRDELVERSSKSTYVQIRDPTSRMIWNQGIRHEPFVPNLKVTHFEIHYNPGVDSPCETSVVTSDISDNLKLLVDVAVRMEAPFELDVYIDDRASRSQYMQLFSGDVAWFLHGDTKTLLSHFSLWQWQHPAMGSVPRPGYALIATTKAWTKGVYLRSRMGSTVEQVGYPVKEGW